jgi:5'(3')-deoxyribonucleotidase
MSKRRKKVIAVDFDDVVFNFNGHFIPWHNERHGSNVSYDAVHSFILTDVYGVDIDTMLGRVRHFTHEMHHTVLPIPGALAALKRLSLHFEPHLLTSRAESTFGVTTDWLHHHLPGVFVNHHFTNEFGGLAHHEVRKKYEVCHDIGAVVHIDDATKHVNSVAEEAGIPAILPERPWNRNDALHPKVTRLHSWPQIVEHLETNFA